MRKPFSVLNQMLDSSLECVDSTPLEDMLNSVEEFAWNCFNEDNSRMLAAVKSGNIHDFFMICFLSNDLETQQMYANFPELLESYKTSEFIAFRMIEITERLKSTRPNPKEDMEFILKSWRNYKMEDIPECLR